MPTCRGLNGDPLNLQLVDSCTFAFCTCALVGVGGSYADVVDMVWGGMTNGSGHLQESTGDLEQDMFAVVDCCVFYRVKLESLQMALEYVGIVRCLPRAEV